MSQQDVGSLPLVEQIVAQVLEGLAEHNAFDAETIARLRDLAKAGGLAKYERVVSALGKRGSNVRLLELNLWLAGEAKGVGAGSKR